ncbi:hypothetical protein ACKWTF_001470 [Chironomus riparius]
MYTSIILFLCFCRSSLLPFSHMDDAMHYLLFVIERVQSQINMLGFFSAFLFFLEMSPISMYVELSIMTFPTFCLLSMPIVCICIAAIPLEHMVEIFQHSNKSRGPRKIEDSSRCHYKSSLILSTIKIKTFFSKTQQNPLSSNF